MQAFIDPATIEITRLHHHLGAVPDADGVRFSIWSPTADRVRVLLGESDSDDGGAGQADTFELTKLQSGYHVGHRSGVAVGTHYQLQIDDGPPIPDPASRAQADSVHGPSIVVDRNHCWSAQGWQPPPIDSWIIYEMHVGTWTEGGTFASAIDRLDELVALGVTAVELMPVADCAGRWNWGYDGVHLFAPNRNYGTPESLRHFIDEAHQRGLAVILDVVYNHLGPEGNYLGSAGRYLSDRHRTAWGEGPNFDDPEFGDECRRFFIANALYWIDEFRFDALRVDAIHCMMDDRRPHVAVEMADSLAEYSKRSDRKALLVAESNVYDPTMTVSVADGGVGFDAQWSDDFVHSLFACLRSDEQMSDREYKPGADLRQVLESGYVYSGTLDKFRQRVAAPPRVEVSRLVRCIQNHDFIGNHPTGQRITALTDRSTHAAAAALLILSPSIPMLFMGEEFACDKPFNFFVDFSDESLRQAVVAGRRNEYPQHDWSGGILPTDQAAMENSKIGCINDQKMWDWYQSLIKLRRDWQSRGLLNENEMNMVASLSDNAWTIHYKSVGVAIGLRRFSPEKCVGPPMPSAGNTVLHSGEHFGHAPDDSWAIAFERD